MPDTEIAKTRFWRRLARERSYPISETRDKIMPLAGIYATNGEILIFAYAHTGRMRIPGSQP
jgi:hypothetical protein